ncbi:hypothetical protein CLOM_g13233, partial [Closterium sp. NIES-68]
LRATANVPALAQSLSRAQRPRHSSRRSLFPALPHRQFATRRTPSSSIRLQVVAVGSAVSADVSNGAVRDAQPRSALPASAWAAVTEDVAVGSLATTASPAAVQALVRDTGVTAVVSLEEEGSYSARGTGWEEEKQLLQEAGLVAVWVPIRESDSAEQAVMLPQAVRVVAALSAMGHRVLLRCPSAVRLSPLVALGYLVLAQGMSISDALTLLKHSKPNADPPANVLIEARERLLAGMTSRVITIAEAIYHTRCTTGQHGDSQSDWAQAQEQCSREVFDKWLLADVSFARSVAQSAEHQVRSKAQEAEAAAAAVAGRAAEQEEGESAAGSLKGLFDPSSWLPKPDGSTDSSDSSGDSSSSGGTSNGDSTVSSGLDVTTGTGLPSLPPDSPPELHAANARVEALSVKLAEARDWLAELEASSSQVMADVASRTAEIEALKRREALWEEELEAAKVKETAMRERLRVKQTGGVQQVRAWGEVEEEIAALKAKVAEDDERNAEAERAIGELRAQVEEAKGQLKKERAAAEEAEGRVAEANERVREEVERVARAQAAAQVAAEERRAVVQELAVVRTARKEEAARVAAARIEQLGREAGELVERLKEAESVSLAADSRAGALEGQMAVLVSRTAAAQQRANAAASRVTFLSGRFNTLEMGAAEATRRAERVEREVGFLRDRDAKAAAAVAANTDTISRLSQEAMHLKESEALHTQREADLSAQLPAAQQQGEELKAQAAAFSMQVAAMARQVTRLKAELDWVDRQGRSSKGEGGEEEGEEHSLRALPALSLDSDATALAPLAAAIDTAHGMAAAVGVEIGGQGGEGRGANGEWVRWELGVQSAAVAAESELEGQMEEVEDPIELLKLLMDRVSEETAAITHRSSHLVAETQQLRQALDAQLATLDQSTLIDGRPLREVVEEVEAEAEQQREEVVQRARVLQWALGGSLALAVVAPLAVYNGYYSEAARSNQIKTLVSELDAATQATRDLEQLAQETEADSVEAMARLRAMEAEVEAQRNAVTRLQSLVPLVAPSVESDEAAQFCRYVPEEYQSPITEQICDGLRQSGKVEAKRGDRPARSNGAAQEGRFVFNNPFNLGWRR